jgi:hypothetical protein
MFEPNHEPSELERRLTELFGKGFHFIVDSISNLLEKIFKKTDRKISNPEEQQEK